MVTTSFAFVDAEEVEAEAKQEHWMVRSCSHGVSLVGRRTD